MSRANTDLQQIQHFVVLIPLTISNALTVTSVAVILALIDPVLTLLALGGLPFLNWLGKRFSSRLHVPAMAIQRESAELASVVEESVSGIRVVKGFGAERAQADRLRTEADDVYRESMTAARVRATYLPAHGAPPQHRPRRRARLRRPPGAERAASASARSWPSTSTSCCSSGRCACSA